MISKCMKGAEYWTNPGYIYTRFNIHVKLQKVQGKKSLKKLNVNTLEADTDWRLTV